MTDYIPHLGGVATDGAADMTDAVKLTEAQERALIAADEKGGAHFGRRGSMMGGAFRRTCETLAARGLVEDCAPFPITDAGRAALAALKLSRREKAYRRGEAWAMLEVHAEREAEKAAQASEPYFGAGSSLVFEMGDSAIRIFRDGRCLGTALRRRAYASGPAWTIYTPDGARFGEADTAGGARFKLRRAAAAVEKTRAGVAVVIDEAAPVTREQIEAASAPRPVWRPTGIGGSILTAGPDGRTLAEVGSSARGGHYAAIWVRGTRERPGLSSRDLGVFDTEAEARAAVLAEVKREAATAA